MQQAMCAPAARWEVQQKDVNPVSVPAQLPCRAAASWNGLQRKLNCSHGYQHSRCGM